MTYRDAIPDRLYVCASCRSAERAPVLGGQVDCARCGAINTLPDRTGLPTSDAAFQPPPDDPARSQQLAAQRGHPREVSPALHAVLGGRGVQPGRKQEALAVWQSLRARSQQGDVMASEDLSTLTSVLVTLASIKPDAALCEALAESAFDAAVLPRHKQETLGYLARAAIAKGDRARAQQYLARMAPWPMELESDSELRVSAAAFATLDGDARRVLALLGQATTAIPVAEALEALATVLRANAYELLGDADTAAQVLRELPGAWLLEDVAETLPALRLCVQSGPAYTAASKKEGARRAASKASEIGPFFGGICALLGLMFLFFAFVRGIPAGIAVIGVAFLALGAAGVMSLRAASKRAAWLWTHGISLKAHVLSAHPNSSTGNRLREYRFALEVMGPAGPYAASLRMLASEHQLAQIVGTDVRVRANPENLQDLIYEE